LYESSASEFRADRQQRAFPLIGHTNPAADKARDASAARHDRQLSEPLWVQRRHESAAQAEEDSGSSQVPVDCIRRKRTALTFERKGHQARKDRILRVFFADFAVFAFDVVFGGTDSADTLH
jgi:hypothetical protein